MADTLTASWAPTLLFKFVKGTSQSPITDRLVAGTNGFATLNKSLTNGTGANKARYRYRKQRTVNNGANDDLDLTALVDDFGVTITFALVKWILIRIVTPATGVRVVVGNAASNVFTGWFGAAAHTEEVRDQIFKCNQIDGWTVSGTVKMLRINNPTGSPIVYDIVILGE
jgi:hypothetical protein